MADREKVIDRLQKVSRYFKSMLKVGYDGDSDIYREHMESVKMAIVLLKEQEAKPVLSQRECKTLPNHYEKKGFCPKCHQVVEWYLNRSYCGFCGQAVKWE